MVWDNVEDGLEKLPKQGAEAGILFNNIWGRAKLPESVTPCFFLIPTFIVYFSLKLALITLRIAAEEKRFYGTDREVSVEIPFLHK